MTNQSAANSWLEHRLLKAWRDAFNTPELKIDETDFFEIGGSSLTFKILQAKIKNLLDYELTAGKLFEASNVISLAKKISHELSDNGSNQQLGHIVNMNDQSRKAPIYICHGMHGDTFEWRFIASELGSTRYVYGLQDISIREILQKKRELTMEDLGEHHANEIMKRNEDIFCIAGYSIGAWVAYSTAVALEKKGAQNIKLYLFEPSALPSIGSYFLSSKKLNKMGLNFEKKGCIWINPFDGSTVDDKDNQIKDQNITDPTFQKTIDYRPGPTRANITLALRKSEMYRMRNYYIAAIARETPNIWLFKQIKAHLGFRRRLHAAAIARSIALAFK